MGEWIIDHLGWIAMGIGVLLVGLIALAGIAEIQAYTKFMESCLAERAEYECTAMWRGAQSRIIPVVVPVR